MDPAIAARIQEWDARPLSGGYQGLRELADAGFSGCATTGSAWLFMLNGRVVGVTDGSLASFESGDVTAYEAPDPTLPLLFAMQERGGETRAEYYTDDHPLPEAHDTLSDAGFTGYIELSENVLSGDYYVVYYGGKSMSAAFVGNAEKLVTGEEAFRQAAEEVGIYEVIDIELDVRDVPEPADAGDDPEPADVGDVPVDVPDEQPTATEEPVATDPGPEQPPDQPTAPDEADPPTAPPDEPTADEPAVSPQADDPTGHTEAADATAQQQSTQPGVEQAEVTEADDPFTQEAAWQEARTIPALDPDETEASGAAEDGGRQPAPPEPAEVSTPQEPTGDTDRLAELESKLEAQSATIAELESKLEATTAEAQQLREERDTLEAQATSVQASTGSGDSGVAGRSLDAETALDQTDLFVRYNTKAGGTLEKAHDGVLEREEVVENLRIDHHTRFEDGAVTIEGRPFDAFLAESLEYRFVTWLITDLLFEIQDTGTQRGLRDLFDALPLVDRVEFYGMVTWRDPDAGETYEEDFDVICRDRMGQALIVANLNDDRDPATGDMMEGLIGATSVVAEGIESLGAAFMVTSSFFQPDALETASNATGGGLLSREKRWSFVKLNRRHGYHLCLVEARGDDFHVAVPEL